MRKMRNLVAANKNEAIQVITASLAIAVLLALKGWGVLVLSDIATAIVGGLVTFWALRSVQQRQIIKQIEFEEEHDVA